MGVSLKHVMTEISGNGLLSNWLFLDLKRAPHPNKRSRVLLQHLRAASAPILQPRGLSKLHRRQKRALDCRNYIGCPRVNRCVRIASW